MNPVLCFGCAREVRYPVLYDIPDDVDVDDRWTVDVIRYCSGCECYREVKSVSVGDHPMFSLLEVGSDEDEDGDETIEEELEDLQQITPTVPNWYGN